MSASLQGGKTIKKTKKISQGIDTLIISCYYLSSQGFSPFFDVISGYIFLHGSFSQEEKEMRTRITLACTDCKRRNYDTTKDKKTHPERMETKKYCPFCKAHTLHKETK